MTQAQTYYIDGYNLIHFSDSLRRLMDTDFEIARDKLVDQIIRWCVSSGNRAKVIFDGQGKRLEQSHNHPATNLVEVLFTSKHKTADSIIERAVYQSKHKNKVIVISADRAITDLCMGMGALTMNPQHFLTSISEAQSETQRVIQKTNKQHMGSMEDRIDATTLERLQKMREGLDPH